MLLVCILTTFTTSATQIYTWVDEKGEKHFSQTPPPKQSGQKYSEKEIKISTPARRPTSEVNDSKKEERASNDKNVLRRGESGPSKKLLKKRNPDKLYLVFTPNINTVIKKAERRKGRKLTSAENKKIRDNAKVKAVTSDEIKNYK